MYRQTHTPSQSATGDQPTGGDRDARAEPEHAHVYCKRYTTNRYIVDYTGTFDVNIEEYRSVFANLGLKDITLSERQSLILTCLESDNCVVVALHEVDPGELYVLKVPLVDAHAAEDELKKVGAEKAVFHYIEAIDKSILVTRILPNSNWLVDNGVMPTSSGMMSVDLLSVLISIAM